MGVTQKTVKNQIPEMIKNCEALNKRKIMVGVLEGAAQWLAAIHEYGCDITVTPKMRAFLHYQGLHLSPNTTEIHIPERSFLRSGHDKYVDEVLKKTELALPQVVSGKMSADTFCDMVGQILASKIKAFAIDLKSPPNHPYTVEQKGSSNPLIDTGQMIEGITWKVE